MGILQNIFSFTNYKEYIVFIVERTQMKAIKSKMAQTMRCDLSHLSRVINGEAHLSPEQADKLSQFLHHNEKEHHYFMLMVEWAKAGTDTLKTYYFKQLEELQVERNSLKNRLNAHNKLSDLDAAKYYSSWLYAAIHVLANVPSYQDAFAMAAYLNVPVSRVQHVIMDLLDMGLLEEEQQRLKVKTFQIHLDSKTTMISKHHLNWRLKAMESIERTDDQDLHYSSVVSLNAESVTLLKDRIVDAIKEVREIVRKSDDQDLWCYSFDVFHMKDDRQPSQTIS